MRMGGAGVGHCLDDSPDRCFSVELLLGAPAEEGARGKHVLCVPSPHVYLPSPQLRVYPSSWTNYGYKQSNFSKSNHSSIFSSLIHESNGIGDNVTQQLFSIFLLFIGGQMNFLFLNDDGHLTLAFFSLNSSCVCLLCSCVGNTRTTLCSSGK